MAPERSGLLRASVVLAALVFSIIAVAMGSSIASGVKSSEVLVVTMYATFTGLAALASWISLRADWAPPLICLFAAGAGTSAYLLEDDFRTGEATGAAFGLVTLPLLIAVFVAIAYTRSRRRSGAPSARVIDD